MRDPRTLFGALLAALTFVPSAGAGPAPIRLSVRLPAEAVLTIDGHPTQQRGAERAFESPPVPAGKPYTYILLATWVENGAPRSATREIRVQAGGTYRVDFLTPEEPAGKGEQKVPAKEPEKEKAKTSEKAAAECVQVYGALVRREGEGGAWQPVREKEGAPFDQLLVALPAAKLHSANGAVLVGLLADVSKSSPYPVLESAITLHPAQDADVDFTYHRGLLELVNLRKDGAAKVRVRVRDQIWNITLDGPEARAILVLHGRHLGGTNLPLPGAVQVKDAKDAPAADVMVLAASGKVTIHTGGQTFAIQAPPGPAVFHWGSAHGDAGIENRDKLPEGAEGPDKAALAFGLAICERTSKFNDRPTGEVIGTLLRGESELDRGVGVVVAGALDDIPHVLDALADPKHADTRDQAVRVLRGWIGRGPGQAQKLYDALTARKYPQPLARSVVQLLVGFDEQQKGQPALYDLLIARLDSKELALRELANWHLVRLVPAGAGIAFDAGATPEARAEAVRRWRELIPEGKGPPSKGNSDKK